MSSGDGVQITKLTQRALSSPSHPLTGCKQFLEMQSPLKSRCFPPFSPEAAERHVAGREILRMQPGDTRQSGELHAYRMEPDPGKVLTEDFEPSADCHGHLVNWKVPRCHEDT